MRWAGRGARPYGTRGSGARAGPRAGPCGEAMPGRPDGPSDSVSGAGDLANRAEFVDNAAQ